MSTNPNTELCTLLKTEFETSLKCLQTKTILKAKYKINKE